MDKKAEVQNKSADQLFKSGFDMLEDLMILAKPLRDYMHDHLIPLDTVLITTNSIEVHRSILGAPNLYDYDD